MLDEASGSVDHVYRVLLIGRHGGYRRCHRQFGATGLLPVKDRRIELSGLIEGENIVVTRMTRLGCRSMSSTLTPAVRIRCPANCGKR